VPRINFQTLHELSSPSSDWTARQPHVRWVARVRKRSASTGVGKSASRSGGPVTGRAMTETISGGDDSTEAVGSAGPTDMSELVGWPPDSRLDPSAPSPMG
jgi:hypothetical protein